MIEQYYEHISDNYGEIIGIDEYIERYHRCHLSDFLVSVHNHRERPNIENFIYFVFIHPSCEELFLRYLIARLVFCLLTGYSLSQELTQAKIDQKHLFVPFTTSKKRDRTVDRSLTPKLHPLHCRYPGNIKQPEEREGKSVGRGGVNYRVHTPQPSRKGGKESGNLPRMLGIDTCSLSISPNLLIRMCDVLSRYYLVDQRRTQPPPKTEPVGRQLFRQNALSEEDFYYDQLRKLHLDDGRALTHEISDMIRRAKEHPDGLSYFEVLRRLALGLDSPDKKLESILKDLVKKNKKARLQGQELSKIRQDGRRTKYFDMEGISGLKKDMNNFKQQDRDRYDLEEYGTVFSKYPEKESKRDKSRSSKKPAMVEPDLTPHISRFSPEEEESNNPLTLESYDRKRIIRNILKNSGQSSNINSRNNEVPPLPLFSRKTTRNVSFDDDYNYE